MHGVGVKLGSQKWFIWPSKCAAGDTGLCAEAHQESPAFRRIGSVFLVTVGENQLWELFAYLTVPV